MQSTTAAGFEPDVELALVRATNVTLNCSRCSTLAKSAAGASVELRPHRSVGLPYEIVLKPPLVGQLAVELLFCEFSAEDELSPPTLNQSALSSTWRPPPSR